MFDAVNNITNEELQFYLDLLGYGGSGDVPWLVMEAQGDGSMLGGRGGVHQKLEKWRVGGKFEKERRENQNG